MMMDQTSGKSMWRICTCVLVISLHVISLPADAKFWWNSQPEIKSPPPPPPPPPPAVSVASAPSKPAPSQRSPPPPPPQPPPPPSPQSSSPMSSPSQPPLPPPPPGPSPTSLKTTYDTLNDFLVRTVESDEACDSLMQVETALNNMLGDSTAPQDAASSDTRKLIAAMVQFTSLTNLVYPDITSCDLNGQKIIEKNVISSGSRIMVPDDELGPLRHIDQAIRQVAKEHADHCRREYPKQFRQFRESTSMTSGLFGYIKKMIDAVVATSNRRIYTILGSTPDERTILKQKALGIADMSHMTQAEAILFFVRAKGADDPNIKYLTRRSDPRVRNRWFVDEEKVRQLLDKYVFQKCLKLDKTLGGILKPATFEQQLYSEGFKYRAVNEHVGELMVWIEYYRLCQRILIEDHEAFVRNIIKFIWKIG